MDPIPRRATVVLVPVAARTGPIIVPLLPLGENENPGEQDEEAEEQQLFAPPLSRAAVAVERAVREGQQALAGSAARTARLIRKGKAEVHSEHGRAGRTVGGKSPIRFAPPWALQRTDDVRDMGLLSWFEEQENATHTAAATAAAGGGDDGGEE